MKTAKELGKKIFTIGEELKKRLTKEGINPDNVTGFITENDKNKRTIITTITLINGAEYKLKDNFIWYAARKNKRW